MFEFHKEGLRRGFSKIEFEKNQKKRPGRGQERRAFRRDLRRAVRHQICLGAVLCRRPFGPTQEEASSVDDEEDY